MTSLGIAVEDGTVGLKIRVATGADEPRLRALIPTSVRALCVGPYTAEQVEAALGPVFGVDGQLIADGTYFVAEWDGTLAGCGGWSKRRTLYGGSDGHREPGPLLDRTTDAALIRAFFIHPDYARRGIGRRLLRACEAAAWAAGFRRAELGATIPGEPLYAACGYAVTDRFEIDLPGGLVFPAAHMVKTLAPPDGSGLL